MVSRGKMAYTPVLVVAFLVAGILGLQILRDRSSSSAALDQKEIEIIDLHRQLKKVLKASEEQQRTITLLKAEKEKLEGETDAKVQQMEADKEKTKRDLEESLQNKGDELEELREQLGKSQRSSEELTELKLQVRELEKKLEAEKSEAKADPLGDAQDGSGEENGGKEKQQQQEFEEEDLVDKSDDRLDEESVIDKSEHSDDGEQGAVSMEK